MVLKVEVVKKRTAYNILLGKKKAKSIILKKQCQAIALFFV